MSLRIFKSAHFDFYDGSHEVAFVYGTGRSNQKDILQYDELGYKLAKEHFQDFLKESDLRVKIAKLATALNIPTKPAAYVHHDLVFFMQVAWHFKMEA